MGVSRTIGFGGFGILILLISVADGRHWLGERGEQWDYIVVGAGASGCAAAAALSEGDSEVVVLEAGEPTTWEFGGRDQKEYFTKFGGDTNVTVLDVPGEALGLQQSPKYFWDTVPWGAQGKGVGGSGVINLGLSFIPSPEDFDSWPENWQYEDMEPFLREAIEKTHTTSRMSTDGELYLQTAGDVAQRFMENQLGFRDVPLNMDPFDRVNVSALSEHYVKGGQRHDSCLAFLHPELSNRENLQLQTWATAKRIVFSSKGQASGVELENGDVIKLKPNGQIVLAAGPLNTPKLLMFSGIGPSSEIARLHRNGMVLNPQEFWIANEEVGAGTHDHPVSLVTIKVPEDLTNGARLFANPDGDEEAQRDYFTSRTNHITQFGLARLGFLAMPGRSAPDFELMSLSVQFAPPDPNCTNCISLLFMMLAPRARDQLRIQTPDLNCDCTPFTCKTGDFCYLNLYYSDEEDKNDAVWGLKTFVEAMEADGIEVVSFDSSPEGIKQFFEMDPQAKLNARHYAGSCAMGRCTDGDLKIVGTKNIFVVDSSTFPTPIRSHNVITSIAVGRKAAAHVQELVD